jgi:xylulokinase
MFIGLDLGTSGLKGIVIDDDQSILAEATAPLEVNRPFDGWSEQAPATWLDATDAVMRALGANLDLAAVRGIGLSGHMHGATLLNAAHEVLRPCILWNDTRSAVEAAALDADPRFRALTGNIVFPGFTAPKLAWIRANEPGVFANVALVLLPKDYLRLWLTGEAVAEMSDAAGTSWLDTGKRDWDDGLLAATGLTRANMPRLVEGSQVSGAGVVKAGEAFVSLGTSGVLFAASDAYQPDAASAVHTFCHALPNTWHQMGVILAAADALNWYSHVVGEPSSILTGNLGPLKAPGRTLFLPYLGGERTPHNNAAVRGHFLHLDHASDRASLTRAVLEGVTHAFRDSFDALSSTGTRITRLIGVGGGSKSDYWVRAIATSLGLPIELPVAGDFGGAFGAARLGKMAATGAGAELATAPRIERVIDPDAALAPAFAEAHQRYRAAYTAIKNLT